MEWYYADQGRQLGPVSEADFEQLIQSGRIKEDTLVWRPGMANWQALRMVRGGGATGGSPPTAPYPAAQAWEAVPVIDPAGFWIRFAAKIMDGLITGFCTVALWLFVFPMDSTPTVTPEQMALYQFKFNFIGVGITVLYSTFFLGRFGATPGKMICRIEVVTLDGGRLSYLHALGRACAEILSGCPTLLIGYLMVAFTREKRALHDFICNTRVVHKR